MDIGIWDLTTVVAKILVYVGVAAAVGGPFVACMVTESSQLISLIRRYCLLTISFALVASGVHFFVQVGALAEMGLAGMWDGLYLEILWQSSAGDSTFQRTLGFSVALFACYFAQAELLTSTIALKRKGMLLALYVVSVLLLAHSFSAVGHSADLQPISLFSSQLLLEAHLIIAAWWMGALWPLWRACHHLDAVTLHKLMHRFGQYAVAIVILILCGVTLAFQFIDSIDSFLHTDYGQSLVTKLLLVVAILLLAAWHKFRVVPALLTKLRGHMTLAKSIGVEMALGFSILAVTTVLTSLVGPSH